MSDQPMTGAGDVKGRPGRQSEMQAKTLRSASRFVLTGGSLVDGTGARPRLADVVVEDGMVREIVPPGAVADSLPALDCSGCIVAPGFIDIHTHSDLSRLVYPDAPTRALQGITTEVTGNCGMSPAPVTSDPTELRAAISGIDVCPQLRFTWRDLPSYLDVVQQTPGATNIAPMLGHGSLRLCAVGHGPVTDDILEGMCRTVDEALDVGVWGVSLGLMYAPGEAAGRRELTALAGRVSARDALLAGHIRSYTGLGLVDAVEEFTTLGMTTGAALQVSHLRSIRDPHGEFIETAFARLEAPDLDVEADAYPYLAGETTLLQLFPSQLRRLGAGAVLAAARSDPEDLARQLRKYEVGPESITIVRTGGEPSPVIGRTLAELAEEAGRDWARIAIDLLERHAGAVGVVVAGSRPEDTIRSLADPRVSIASDGKSLALDYTAELPHPRSIGTFPRALAALLGHGLQLEEVVRKATGKPAGRLGMTDRGVLAVGKAADIVAFAVDDLADNATYAEPLRPPSGIRHVIVNGELVVEGSRPTGRRPGRLLRRG